MAPAAESRRRILEHRRLIIVSNRGPVEYRLDNDRRLRTKRGAGGVVSALGALSADTNVSWVCSALTDGDRFAAEQATMPRPKWLAPNLEIEFVVVPEQVQHWHYNVISNPLLWFLQHYLWNTPYEPRVDDFVRNAWEQGYVVANQAFAAHAAALARPRPGERHPFVLVQDYQLYLAPAIVRQRCPDVVLSHFVHIPWPESIYWQLLPGDIRWEILHGLCACDIVGFQTDQFVWNFLETCRDFIGATVDWDNQRVLVDGHMTQVRAYPISIDTDEVRRAAARGDRYLERIQTHRGQRQAIVRVDRLDPSKNILRGFDAYRLLLERRPDFRERVVFLAFLVPSRTMVPEYRHYRNRVFALVKEINARFGTPTWRPIVVIHENNYVQALAGMRVADVILVNSILDGMNLVAKEAVTVNERNATLVLSEGAGAYQQLGEFAISVGAADVDGTAKALEQALAMPEHERAERATRMRRLVETYDLSWWIDTQLRDLDDVAMRKASHLGERRRTG